MQNKKQAVLAGGLVALSLLYALPAFAENESQGGRPNRGVFERGMMRGMSGVFGTVSAINGTTLTITRTNPKDKTVATFSVNASNAKIIKNNIASTLSSVAVGDTLMVRGALNGTSIIATEIRDGFIDKENERSKNDRPLMPTLRGDGQPVVAGTITSINGSTLIISNPSNVSYSVSLASTTRIVKGGVDSTISGLLVGNAVVVQGAVNGNNILASSIMEQGSPRNTTATSTEKARMGFMGGIGKFLFHLFGF